MAGRQCAGGGRASGGRREQEGRRRRDPVRDLSAGLGVLPRGSSGGAAIWPGDASLVAARRLVDDPADASYNRLVALPYPAHAEPMWLDDVVYDLVVVVGYNMNPVVPDLGSAIFLHIARPDFSPTAGCIAVEREALLRLLPVLGPGSTITIRG